MFSVLPSIIIIILILLLWPASSMASSSSTTTTSLPIGHYEGSWKLIENNDDDASLIKSLIQDYFPHISLEVKNDLNKIIMESNSSSSTNNRVFPARSGILRLHSVLTLLDDGDDAGDVSTTLKKTSTSKPQRQRQQKRISTTSNYIQGDYIAPGQLREVVSDDLGECLFLDDDDDVIGDLDHNKLSLSTSYCYNYAKGFLGFWEMFSGYSSSDENYDKNKNMKTSKEDVSHLTRFQNELSKTITESLSSVRTSKDKLKNSNKIDNNDDDEEGDSMTITTTTAITTNNNRKSFRQLLNPDLWSEDEEAEFSKCFWITSLRRGVFNTSRSAADIIVVDNNKTTISSFLSRLASAAGNLFRFVEPSSSLISPSSTSSSLVVAAAAHQSIEGLSLVVCPNKTFSSEAEDNSIMNSNNNNNNHPLPLVLVIKIEADKSRYSFRMMSSNWFAGLTVISAGFNALAIFSLNTVTRRNIQAQRSLSFACLLWIVSWDLLQLGVFQLLAKLTARSARIVYLGMFLRVLTFYIGGVPMVLRIRKTQNTFLLGEQRGRWLVADFSVWRYFGLITLFTITLFLLAERILTWPMMLIFSGVFWPQIVQNVREDEASQPILQFTWGIFMSLSIPVFCLTQDFVDILENPFNFEPRGSAALAFTLSLLLQAVLLHAQVRFGARCFIPRMFLPAKYPYEIDRKKIRFVSADELALMLMRKQKQKKRSLVVVGDDDDEDNEKTSLLSLNPNVIIGNHTTTSFKSDEKEEKIYIEQKTTCSVCQGYLQDDPFSFDDDDDDEDSDQDGKNDDNENEEEAEQDDADELQKLVDESVSSSRGERKETERKQRAKKKEDSSAANIIIWKTPCDHYFHGSCLSNWLQVRLVCPVCREIVPKP